MQACESRRHGTGLGPVSPAWAIPSYSTPSRHMYTPAHMLPTSRVSSASHAQHSRPETAQVTVCCSWTSVLTMIESIGTCSQSALTVCSRLAGSVLEAHIVVSLSMQAHHAVDCSIAGQIEYDTICVCRKCSKIMLDGCAASMHRCIHKSKRIVMNSEDADQQPAY